MNLGTILLSLPVVHGLTMGCSSSGGGTECSCEDPTVRIEVPADRAPSALGVTLSGRACPDVTAQCTQAVGSGCAEYTFQATGEGVCDVDITFGAGPADFDAQVSFVSATCCPGFYVSPPSASPIEVPSLGDDAGGGE